MREIVFLAVVLLDLISDMQHIWKYLYRMELVYIEKNVAISVTDCSNTNWLAQKHNSKWIISVNNFESLTALG